MVDRNPCDRECTSDGVRTGPPELAKAEEQQGERNDDDVQREKKVGKRTAYAISIRRLPV